MAERVTTFDDSPALDRGPEVDLDRARRRAAKWPHADQRREAEGLSEAGFLSILGESLESLFGRSAEPPEWWRRLRGAYSLSRSAGMDEDPGEPSGLEVSGLLTLAEPLIRDGARRLLAGARKLAAEGPSPPFDPGGVCGVFLPQLLPRLQVRMNRTLALDVQVARLQGELRGESPEERFASYVERLPDPETCLELLAEYPVLARLLAQGVDQWVQTSLEILRHLRDDWPDIRRAFGLDEDPGVLERVSGDSGDAHRDGRSVRTVHLSGGLRLVYKPRSVAVEARFQDLLGWINDRGLQPPLHTLTVLDRGYHGWIEYVEAAACEDEAEVRRFYERQGVYLGLLTVLEATDFHHENLIAAGEHPVLVDLETLFHPNLSVDRDTAPGGSVPRTPLRVGLLPRKIWSEDAGEQVDLSGLGAAGDQSTPERILVIEGAGTDEIHLVRKHGRIPPAENRPRLRGDDVYLPDYAEEVAAGFARIYRLLLAHRDVLLVSEGPLAAFAGVEVRVVVRSTLRYSQLLLESFHPNVLGDALDRDRLLDRLWGAADDRPFFARLVGAERRDLERADIPIFTTRPDSRDLRSSDGEVLTNLLAETGLARAETFLGHMSEDDLAFQLWILRGALKALDVSHRPRPKPPTRTREEAEPASPERLLEGARAVGKRLASRSLSYRDEASWFSFRTVGTHHWQLDAVGPNLYDGLAGIALFLGYLGVLTGDASSTEMARGALTRMRRELERDPALLPSLGAYVGRGGALYTLVHLAALWNEPELLDEAEALARSLEELVADDRTYDLFTGSAGAVLSLLVLHGQRPSGWIRDLAVRCGEHLLDAAVSMDAGLGWKTKGISSRPLAGLSHGGSGVALALTKLSAVCGEARFHDAVLGALDYERSLYSPELGHWLDLRVPFGEAEEDVAVERLHDLEKKDSLVGWCNGAPGIALARLAALGELDSDEVRRDLDLALRSTLEKGFGQSHCLCHGDLGNLDCLLVATETLGDEELEARIRCLAAGVLSSIGQQGYLCGAAAGTESLGLMMGLAGIGYGFLRLAAPRQVPSVLMLEGPVSQGC